MQMFTKLSEAYDNSVGSETCSVMFILVLYSGYVGSQGSVSARHHVQRLNPVEVSSLKHHWL